MSRSTNPNANQEDEFSHPLLVLRKLEDEDLVLEEWARRITGEKEKLEVMMETLRRQIAIKQEALDAQRRALAMEEAKEGQK
mmetsp:Transcript_63259/g.112862  ORF Transcript_63259/g.112862 Transcript_63259/m.112862 type:complete len:82 (+) Transcript_63259:88-333(+)